MFEKYLCEEAKNGNCKIDCSHKEPHSFMKRYCNLECPEKDKIIKCVEINMENYVR